MRSDAILVAVWGSWWIVGETESEHRLLESGLKEVLVKVEGFGKDWKQGEGKGLHSSCITKHLKLDSDSTVATMSTGISNIHLV